MFKGLYFNIRKPCRAICCKPCRAYEYWNRDPWQQFAYLVEAFKLDHASGWVTSAGQNFTILMKISGVLCIFVVTTLSICCRFALGTVAPPRVQWDCNSWTYHRVSKSSISSVWIYARNGFHIACLWLLLLQPIPSSTKLKAKARRFLFTETKTW